MNKSVIAILLFTLMGICGCTQNNGHIGPIFGSWSLIEISAGDTPLEMPEETVFSFQNKVVRVEQINEKPYERATRYGNFLISENVLSLRFMTQLTPEGEGTGFLMPSWLYFPEDVMPLRFDIKVLNGSRMVLVLNDGARDITYSFEKTW